MTQPAATPEEMALARKCADEIGARMSMSEARWDQSYQAALLAIRETSERAAKWMQGPTVPDHSDEGGCPFDKAASAIRNGDHLK